MAQSILEYLNNLKENFVPKNDTNNYLFTNEIIYFHLNYADTMYVDLEVENEGDGLLEFEIGRLVEKKSKARMSVDQ